MPGFRLSQSGIEEEDSIFGEADFGGASMGVVARGFRIPGSWCFIFGEPGLECARNSLSKRKSESWRGSTRGWRPWWIDGLESLDIEGGSGGGGMLARACRGARGESGPRSAAQATGDAEEVAGTAQPWMRPIR